MIFVTRHLDLRKDVAQGAAIGLGGAGTAAPKPPAKLGTSEAVHRPVSEAGSTHQPLVVTSPRQEAWHRANPTLAATRPVGAAHSARDRPEAPASCRPHHRPAQPVSIQDIHFINKQF